jgi:hypothetical protein
MEEYNSVANRLGEYFFPLDYLKFSGLMLNRISAKLHALLITFCRRHLLDVKKMGIRLSGGGREREREESQVLVKFGGCRG